MLASKFPTISTTTIQTLGNQSIGLTEGQLSSASPDVINSTLPTLSTITGWNQGQVNNIIQNLVSGGFNVSAHYMLQLCHFIYIYDYKSDLLWLQK